MLLHELSKSQWLNRKSKRRWRWDSSWKWNYSWRWQKWQWSRSWWKMPAWFEGWQTPLNLRLPKLKWFKRYYKLVDQYQIINLDSIEKDNRIGNNVEITKIMLKEFNYIKNVDWLVKVLWRWEITKKVIFVWMDIFSKTAKEKIEKAWWKTE